MAIDGDPAAIAQPTIRQRRRLFERLSGFADDQWLHPSRCAGWTSRDVVVHLDSTNFFWTQSILGGQSGEPTRFLATFDPVSTPAHLVAQAQDLSSAAVLERFAESTRTLTHLLESLDTADWTALAEAPPGHISVSAVVHHALWDSWIHERDIVLPLGDAPTIEPDEVAACLRYAAALGPAIALTRGGSRRGRLGIRGSDPDVRFVVDVSDRVRVTADGDADVTLEGPADELVDELSIRRPFHQHLPPEHAWLVAGLAETFDAG